MCDAKFKEGKEILEEPELNKLYHNIYLKGIKEGYFGVKIFYEEVVSMRVKLSKQALNKALGVLGKVVEKTNADIPSTWFKFTATVDTVPQKH